ncbi:MAG: hypothetical protein Q7K43_04725, partial [Candidatus Woesearchaeota archaeon]|nr:hypothetical protein [Candidatus Woesearchaeota archaeon]
KKDTAQVIGSLEQLRESLREEIDFLNEVLRIDSLVVEPVLREFDKKIKNTASDKKNAALQELSVTLGGVLQSVLVQAMHSVSKSLRSIARLNYVISTRLSEGESSRLEEFKSIQSQSSSLVSSEEQVFNYLGELSKTLVPQIVAVIQEKIRYGAKDISAIVLNSEIKKIIAPKISSANTAKFVEYLKQVLALFTVEEKSISI